MAEITDTTCHTWTHHVAGAVRVECVAHGVVADCTAEKGQRPTAREQATAAQREHQAEVEQ